MLVQLRDSMPSNLKFIGSIAIAALLLSSAPSWAGKNPSVAAVRNVPMFAIPTDNAERLELAGFTDSLPVHQAVELNSRVSPVVIQPSSTKFHVSGQNCWIKDGVLKATEPAICRVIAARAGNPFSPITVLSTPTLFYFGTIAAGSSNARLPLPTLNVPIPTLVISNLSMVSAPGVPFTLTTNPDGSSAVTYSEMSGTTSCVIAGIQLVKATPGTCRIRAIKAQDGASGVQFSQIVVFTFHGATAQAPFDINESTSRSLGDTIILSTSGGSGNGAVSYEIIGGTAAGTISGTSLTASTAGTIDVVATKQGDTQYAPAVSLPVTFEYIDN